MAGVLGYVVWLAFIVLMIVSVWKVFEKAGQPGWAAIIPIYNAVVACQVAGKPGWWVILLLIPVVNIIFGIIITYRIARNFGYGAGMTVLMIFLPFIGYPILGFGDAVYKPV